MSSELQGNIIVDTGPLIELLGGTRPASFLKESLEQGRVRAMTGELNLGELRYLTCRKAGWSEASQVIDNLLGSGYFRVLPAGEFLERAARIKCARALSFVDCVTISMAESMHLPVLYSSHEDELDREIKKKAFEPKMLFLDSLAI